MFSHPVRSGEKILGDDEIKGQSRCREKAGRQPPPEALQSSRPFLVHIPALRWTLWTTAADSSSPRGSSELSGCCLCSSEAGPKPHTIPSSDPPTCSFSNLGSEILSDHYFFSPRPLFKVKSQDKPLFLSLSHPFPEAPSREQASLEGKGVGEGQREGNSQKCEKLIVQTYYPTMKQQQFLNVLFFKSTAASGLCYSTFPGKHQSSVRPEC